MIDFSIMTTAAIHTHTASVADLRNNFRQIAAWIDNGQTVIITRRGRDFAELAPKAVAKKPFKMPDFAAQRKKIWGNRRPFTDAEVREMKEFELEGQEG